MHKDDTVTRRVNDAKSDNVLVCKGKVMVTRCVNHPIGSTFSQGNTVLQCGDSDVYQ